MDNKEDTSLGFLFHLTIILIVASAALSFYRYYVLGDYTLYIKEDCNPNYEECLSEECEDGDPRCIPSEDGFRYYKESYQTASSIR